MASLRAIHEEFPDVRLLAISLDPADDSKELAKKIASTGGGAFPYPLLSDPGSKTIDAWGVRDPQYAGTDYDGLPHPAVFVLDRKGRVSWSRIESDYRLRPTLDEIRDAIREVK